jgi:hypothetical protein
LKDILILEAYDAKSECLNVCLTRSVLFFFAIMNGAVNFNYQLCFGAVEIYDERTQSMLTSDVVTAELTAAYGLPKALFRGCGFLSRLSRERTKVVPFV